jgi:hypothetical protein
VIAAFALLQWVVVEPRTEPPSLEPAPKVEIGATLQVEAGERPDATDTPGFRVSRARLRLDAKVERVLRLEGFVELEVSPMSQLLEPPLADAWIGMDVASKLVADLGRLRIGQLKVPFGGELARPPQELMFVDRAAPLRCLAPGRQQYDSPVGPSLLDSTGRDVGLRWDGDFGPLGIAAGVWNGEGPNVARSGTGPHAGPLVTARSWLHVAHLEIGASFDRGDNAPIANCEADSPAVRADITSAAGDFLLHWKWVRAEAEYVYQEASDRVRWGLSGAAGFYAIPDFLLLAFRAERVPDYWQWSAGLALAYLGERYRLQYSYTHRTRSDQSTSSANLIAFTLAY